MVLLHGFPQGPSSYDSVVPQLTAEGFRALVPTQRGYAATARPTRRRDYKPQELVDDIIALLDTAGIEKTHLVGHDWGGAVAWAVAGGHPDRVRSLTVLSTPHPAAFVQSMVRSSQALRSWYMGLFQLPLIPEFVVSKTLRKTLSDSGLPARDVDRYVTDMAEPGALSAALNWYRGMPLGGRPLSPDVAVPTTYVWGRNDFALGRAAADRTGEHVTGDYRFDVLNAGHWLPETRADEVAGAILRRARRTSQ
jgi:pimeloyl-ACP methyl ester carboxylesterase